MKLTEVFETVLKEASEKHIPDFNGNIKDEAALKSAFEYAVNLIKRMSSFFVSINDISGYKSLFESESDHEDEDFNATVNNIRICGAKIERICGMIYEFVYKETVSDRGVESNFVPAHAPDVVNGSTHQAQTAVRDYSGQQSIEIACQAYDVTVDNFNRSITAMNERRGLHVPYAEQPHLVTLVRET